MVQNSAEYFLKCTLLWLGANKLTDPLPDWISPAVFQEYLRTFRRPDNIHAICEDYRAAASIDLAHDKADLEKKIQCPLLVLWSEKGPFHRMYDVLQTWQERAVQAEGKVMPTGHFLPEQMPEELTQEIRDVSGCLKLAWQHANLSFLLSGPADARRRKRSATWSISWRDGSVITPCCNRIPSTPDFARHPHDQ
jgi:haloacetate dehalogenase